MYQIATCTATILRGTTTNQFSDTVDNAVPVYTGVIASIREEGRVVFDPATQQPRVVRSVAGTVPSDTDVLDSDQIRDDTHGVTYSVEAVTKPVQPGFTPDTELQLRRITP